MPLKEEVLGEFLGDEKFPVSWTSETEKLLFWVYDDLHCPKPLSPMYEDIGGWWLSCDHMFRRFGTPFASDWIYKNINGYLYTAAIPAEAGLIVDTQEYNYRTNPIVPEDNAYAGAIGAYLGAVLPVYGHNFEHWWRTRFVPEMTRNFEYIEGMLDRKAELSLADLAVLLEDTIDMHDRHWKIHWMLNFAQLSATLNLRAVMEKTHGKIDEVLLGRLQNSANDRNWDKIRALWEMKEEVKADPELAAAFQKLGEALPEVLGRHVHRTLDVMARRLPDPEGIRRLHVLTQAWAERRVVELTYDPSTYDPTRAARTARVRPWLIEPSTETHALYLIGWDETRGAVRTFKLERIRRLTLTTETFDAPPDGAIEEALERAWGIISDQEPTEVLLRFAPAVAARVAETTWHPTQAVEREGDGALRWRATVSGTVEIRSWILSWGPDVEVLAPVELRAEVADLLAAAAARYR